MVQLESAAGERRCPNCGGLVAADAEWCSLCFHSLVERPEEPEPSPTTPAGGGPPPPPPPDGVEAAGPLTGSVPPPPPVPDEGTASPESADPEEHQASPTWICPNCGEVNPLEENNCRVCGTTYFSLFQEAIRPQVSRRDAITRSLLYPGLGHALVGRAGDGVARGVLFTWALGTAILVLVSRGDRPLGPLLGITALYLLVAAGIYMLTALEAGQLAEGGDLIVSSRGLAWFSAGLVIVTLILAFLLISNSSEPADDSGPQPDAPVVQESATVPLEDPTGQPVDTPTTPVSEAPSVAPRPAGAGGRMPRA